MFIFNMKLVGKIKEDDFINIYIIFLAAHRPNLISISNWPDTMKALIVLALIGYSVANSLPSEEVRSQL